MADCYGKFRASLKSNESKPKIGLTKQTWLDTPFIIRGKYEGIPVWYYILVSFDKIKHIKSQPIGKTLNSIEFGNIIQYRDDQQRICSMFGWGINPPKSLKTWFEQNYGVYIFVFIRFILIEMNSNLDDGTIDETINIKYEKDDIRLCTIQRLRFDELIGINQFYHKRDHFHYIRLSTGSQTSLAYRSGMRNFDRLISFNGINIEQETPEKIAERFKKECYRPIQILVCSPATYQHYKLNNINIHANLSTVQFLEPAFDLSLSNLEISTPLNISMREKFVVVQMETNNLMCTVTESSDLRQVNDIYLIENQGKFHSGQIKFKGSQDQCEHFRYHCIHQFHNENIDRILDYNKSIAKINQHTRIPSEKNILDMFCFSVEITRFEDLPNEIIFDILNYLTLEHIHCSFIDLNSRLNSLIRSSNNLTLIFDEKPDRLLMESYKFQLVHLIIDTSNECDLAQFFNLHSLIIYNRNLNHIKQIRPKTLPNLVNLLFLLKPDFKVPVELIDDIFSNRFPYIRYVNLGHIDKPFIKSWSITYSLEILFIRCDQLMIIENILEASPNLKYFQIHILNNFNNIHICSSSFKHQLKRFTLWSDDIELKLNQIDALLTYIPYVTHLYVQTTCQIPFIELAKNIIYRLHLLSQFDCFIKEILTKNERIYDLDDIHKISSLFHTIECVVENDKFRTFATE
ncbi:unnamed protein product [Rotaria socialis]|uniref:F-box domain-containing protein n=1 Tax=Rotaria socialis TaxID=392032 RepID=A0A817ZNN6_9BILA|nr:unnamed protein product [Rotaria socialis]CAF4615463.1 unnamed protein product [Rotaria socialis]